MTTYYSDKKSKQYVDANKQRKEAALKALNKAKAAGSAGASCTNLTLSRATASGTSVLATWKFAKSHVDHFEVDWEVYDGSRWESGSYNNVSTTSKVGELFDDLFGDSDTSVQYIRARVKPVSTRRTVTYKWTKYTREKESSGKNKGKYVLKTTTETVKADNVPYWTGKMCSYVKIVNPAYADSLSAAEKEMLELPQLVRVSAEYDQASSAVTVSWDSLGSNVTDWELIRYDSILAEQYASVAKGSGYVTASAVDTTVSDGSSYWYALRLTSKGGTVTTGMSDQVDTRPMAPRIDLARRVADDAVRIEAYLEGDAGDTVTVYWSSVSENVADPDGNNERSEQEFRVTNPGGDNAFSVYGIGAGKVFLSMRRGSSEVSNVVSVVMGTTAKAPTLTFSRASVVRSEGARLSWVHNCEDDSEQTSAVVTVKVGSGAERDITVSGAAAVLQYDTSSVQSGDHVEWSVRTAGYNGVLGERSAIRTFRVYERPTLTCSVMDGSQLTALPMVVTLGHGEQESVQYANEWSLYILAKEDMVVQDDVGDQVLVPAGAEVWRGYMREGSEGYGRQTCTVTIGASDAAWVNGQALELHAVAGMSSGIQSNEVVRTFTTSWEAPRFFPSCSLVPAPDWTMHVYPCAYAADQDGNESESLAEGVLLSVYRMDGDGGWVEVATGIENAAGVCVIDPFPTFGNAMYRIVANDIATDWTEHYDESVPMPYDTMLIQWDAAVVDSDDDGRLDGVVGSFVELPYNLDLEESYSKDVRHVEYIGRQHPVAYYGTQVSQRESVKSDIVRDVDEWTLMQLRALATYMGNCYVRTPDGLGYWASVDVSEIGTRSSSALNRVSVSIVRVEE